MHIIEVAVVMSGDQDVFKVPSLPISRTKSEDETVKNEAVQQEVERTAKLITAPQTEGTDKGDKAEQSNDEAKAKNEDSTGEGGDQFPSLSYVEPYWSGTPAEPHSLLIVKNGTEIGKLVLDDKPYHTFGRLPNCDITLEHPSISRYHAILQYRPSGCDKNNTNDESSPEAGFYIYDLGSTHGTYLNKQKVRPRAYCRLRIGQMVRFGGSTRLFILEAGQLGQEAVEEAAQNEIAALSKYKEEVKKREEELLELEKQWQAMEKEREEMGVMWGMVDDEIDMASVDKADAVDLEREAYYRDDPKKALKKYFDREDLELEFETVETGKKGIHCIRVSLPVQSAGGEMMVAEATVKGKRKEAITQCALEACRLLDSYGMLRQASQSRKKVAKNWEEDDFYSSDEDTFLDRTGIIEKKRHGRMKKVGKAEDAVDTHETLNKKLVEVTENLQALEAKLAKSKKAEAAIGKGDSLDVYMKSVKDKLDKGTVHEMKLQINKLKKEETRLRNLVKLTQPTELPALRQPESNTSPVANEKNSSKKQYGLSRLPVDRKKAYLQETAAQHYQTSISEQCEVEYDSDEDTDNVNLPKTDSTIAAKTEITDTSKSDNSKLNNTHEQVKQVSSNESSSERLRIHPVDKDTLSADSETECTDQGNASKDQDEVSKDISKEVVSPKRTKMIGPSLGPLRKRRRRSSETKEDVTSAKKWAGDYDPDYAGWLPPSDQSGDGKTHLNAKYGY